MRIIRAFFIFIRRCGLVPAQEWRSHDSVALASFLSTQTGSKLRLILVAEIAAANERAAFSRGNAFEAGFACGYRALMAQLQAYSANSPAETGENNEDEANLDHLAP